LTKSLGDSLPDDLYRALSSGDTVEGEDANKVIILTTVDEDGWPRHAMLSHFEVVAGDRRKVRILTYEKSKTTVNLMRSGKGCFLFVDKTMSYYVRVDCRRVKDRAKAATLEISNEALFVGLVADVMEDKFQSAPIRSGITFSGYDPGMSRNERRVVRSKLLELDI
jgi:hypothetical protein